MQLTHNINGMIDGTVLPTKGNAETLGKLIASDACSGFTDPLQTIVRLDAIIAACESAKKALSERVLSELDKHPDGKAEELGAAIQRTEVGVKYDYSKDAKWAQVNREIEILNKERKDREAFLKALSKPIMETDMETGETFEAEPPTKTSTTSFKITLDK